MDHRLTELAQMVSVGARVADIGTDHAYLPIALVSSGKCPSAIACDVRQGPLDNARRAVSGAGLSDRIECRLGDGLSVVAADEVDEVIIAGMGGELIASILAACPWSGTPGHRFYLQPMTRPEALRRYLFSAGFAIRREVTTAVGKRVYLMVEAEPMGAKPLSDEVAALVGTVGRDRPSDTDRLYLQKTQKQLQKRLSAEECGTPTGEETVWRQALAVIEQRLGGGGDEE